MSEKAAGLDFQEAFAQALAEEEVATSEPTTDANVGPGVAIGSEVEQPAVETEDEVGLFSGLVSDQKNEHPLEDSLHKVKVNGETLEVTYQELINGYSRQADYTQDKQELSKLRKQHESAITLWEALESDYAGTVQALMARSGMKGKVAPKPELDIEQLVEAKLQEKLASDPRMQAFEQEQSRQQLEYIFAGLEREFNITLAESDKHTVLVKANEIGSTDLRYVVWLLLQERENILAEQRNLELVSTATGRRSGAAEDLAPQVQHYSTVTDAWKAALAEEGVS